MKKEYSEINISAEKDVDINEGMIGLFYEDLSNSADGGLYAEQIENRSFEQQTPSFKYETRADGKKIESLDKVTRNPGYAWTIKTGAVEYKTDVPLNENNIYYARLSGGENGASLSNKAYDGIFVEKGKSYSFSVWANAGDYRGDIAVSVDKNGKNLIAGSLIEEAETARSDGWAKYSAVLKASATARGAVYTISMPVLKAGEYISLDMVSMMPCDAVMGIFRRDMAEAIREINPGFLRFPGGCVVEGYNLSNRYRWKDTVGAVEERRQTWNRWAFKQENYNETYGLGFYEYFMLCEYLNCEPIPILNVGMACEYNTSEVVPLYEDDGKTYTAEFMTYVQDAVDLIEFANGSPDTEWGGLRKKMGHSEPFNLTMLGIGNEQWAENNNMWYERYEAFEKAIHKIYPNIKLISSAGPDVVSDKYTDAWNWIRARVKDNSEFTYAVDEHNYNTKEWLFENDDFYDNYSRDVFVYIGEYAAKTYTDDNGITHGNDMISALSEAAFLTGAERNADVVRMASYAPLFSKAKPYSHWAPDMIWFNDTELYKTPNYYVQKLFGCNMGSYTLKSSMTVSEGSGMYQSSSYDKKSGDVIIKVINPRSTKETLKININGFDVYGGEKYILSAASGDAVNSFEAPDNISDKTETIENTANIMTETLLPYSLTVFRIHTK